MERPLLLLVEPAKFERHTRRQHHLREPRSYLAERGAKVNALQARRDGNDRAQPLAGKLGGFASPAHFGHRAQRHGGARRRVQLHFGKRGQVAMEVRRVAHAHADEPIAGAELRSDGAFDRGFERGANVVGAQPVTRGGALVDHDLFLGAAQHDTVEGVDDSGDRPDFRGDAARGRLDRGLVGAEDLDLDRLGHAREVADQVLQHLRELDMHAGNRSQNASAHVVHDLVDRARALLPEAHREVTAVRFGKEKSQLRAGAPRKRRDLGRRPENVFDLTQQCAGVGERTGRRRDVVERESALVERGQIIRAHRVVKHEGRDETGRGSG